MIKKSSTYLTPECNIIDFCLECILCSSVEPDEDGFTIEEFEKLPGSWS